MVRNSGVLQICLLKMEKSLSDSNEIAWYVLVWCYSVTLRQGSTSLSFRFVLFKFFSKQLAFHTEATKQGEIN